MEHSPCPSESQKNRQRVSNADQKVFAQNLAKPPFMRICREFEN